MAMPYDAPAEMVREIQKRMDAAPKSYLVQDENRGWSLISQNSPVMAWGTKEEAEGLAKHHGFQTFFVWTTGGRWIENRGAE